MIKIGTIIQIINMKNEPKYKGRIGKVEWVDSIGQIHGSWGSCALDPTQDEFEIKNNPMLIKVNKN